MLKKVAVLAVAGSALVSSAALAATTTATMNVSAVVTSNCALTANPLDFGSFLTPNSPVTANTTIVVNCTNGTAYEVGVNGGASPGGTTGRRLAGSNGGTMDYDIYTDNALTTRFDVTGSPSGTVQGTGNGANATIQVFGQIPAQPTPAAGTFTDSLLVTVAY